MQKKNLLLLSVLSLLGGILCKIYDDLVDNDLYSDFILLRNYREYIENFLKLTFAMILSYISSFNVVQVFIFSILNYFYLFLDDSFNKPYEFIALNILFFWTLLLMLFNFSDVKKEFTFYPLFFFGFFLINSCFFDIFLFKNVEYSYKKLFIRVFAIIFCILFLIVNYLTKFAPYNDIYFYICFIFGYCLTSCFFQIYLLFTDKYQEKKTLKKCKEKKKKKKKKKKVNLLIKLKKY